MESVVKKSIELPATSSTTSSAAQGVSLHRKFGRRFPPTKNLSISPI